MAECSVEKIKVFRNWDFKVGVNHIHVLLKLLALLRYIFLVGQSYEGSINLVVCIKKHWRYNNLFDKKLFWGPTCPIAARPTRASSLHHLKRICFAQILLLNHRTQPLLLLNFSIAFVLISICRSFANMSLKILKVYPRNMKAVRHILLRQRFVKILFIRCSIHMLFPLDIVFNHDSQLLHEWLLLWLVDNRCKTLNPHCLECIYLAQLRVSECRVGHIAHPWRV